MLKEIIGSKITLKVLEPTYFKDYHDMFSATVRKMLDLPEVATQEETENFLKEKMKHLKMGKTVFYCIFDNADKKLIGSIEIREPNYKGGQLGALLSEHYWGAGRYQEALDLLLHHYFELKDCDSVNAFVDKKNARSLKAHQKYGFDIVREFEENGKQRCELSISKNKFLGSS